MKAIIHFITAIILVLFLSLPAPADTIIVRPDGTGDYPTIQAAINAAASGDTVLVADGIYTGDGNRDIDFLGKAITVRSQNGPQNCIIDCNKAQYDQHYGFYFHNNEDGNSTLNGFTITSNENCYRGPVGGLGIAIYCNNSAPRIIGCKITRNSHTGIRCVDSSPFIENCNINENGRGITQRSGNPIIIRCIISENCEGGIYCITGNLTIVNSTIRSNQAYDGAGIYCDQSILTLEDCVITENRADFSGSGVYSENSSLYFSNCVISNNLTEGGSGGGIETFDSEGEIIECKITNNSAVNEGGISWLGGNLNIRDSVVINNRNKGSLSQGILCAYGSITVENCIIRENEGLGVRLFSSDSASIKACKIISNTEGGIAAWHSGRVSLNNCIISGNRAIREGAGVRCRGGLMEITNCTISGNAGIVSGGIYCWDSTELTIHNSIVWGNEAPEEWEIYLENGYTSVSYSDLEGGKDAVYAGDEYTLNWGIGNIDLEPSFVNSGYWDDANDSNIIVEPNVPNAVWIDGDYHLLATSPCIDTGDPNYIPEPNETDLDGNPRVTSGRIDMGAYEYWPPIQAQMTITPKTLNCSSKGKYIKAHVTFPEGISPDEVDLNEPALLDPPGLESKSIAILGSGRGAVQLKITFDRQSFCEELTDTGQIELTLTGRLATGQLFSASDKIRVQKIPTGLLVSAQPKAKPDRITR